MRHLWIAAVALAQVPGGILSAARGGNRDAACDEGFPPVAESMYVLPYKPGETYEVIQGNCYERGGHRGTFAYDFDMEVGDTVYASRAGTVIIVHEHFKDMNLTSGRENNVFVQHSDGTVLRYTHLTENGALVVVGDRVMQGQPIGLSGNSGATGGDPHLHFALYRDRSSYDRENSAPVNFRNAVGRLDENGALIMGESYMALPFEPDGR